MKEVVWMSEFEKINIYVPEEINKQLRNDALLFEIYKKDRRTVNFNRFLSMLLCGYFDVYAEENKITYDLLMGKMAETSLKEKERSELANRILREVIMPTTSRKKGVKSVRLSLKPTEETSPLIYSIASGQMAGDDSVSQYFCRMLIAYCKKPFSEREQIVFRDTYAFLQDACRKGQSINFMTIWNDTDVRHVIPYCIATGEEEMFNYLLCEETNPKTGKPQPATYHLNRITRLTKGIETKSISYDVKKFCDRMKEFAPQYVINNNDEEICVRLTYPGERNFIRTYFGKPKPCKIIDDEQKHFYYFSCSSLQIFQFFKRFEPNTVMIIKPEWLRIKLYNFFHENELAYNEWINEGGMNNGTSEKDY